MPGYRRVFLQDSRAPFGEGEDKLTIDGGDDGPQQGDVRLVGTVSGNIAVELQALQGHIEVKPDLGIIQGQAEDLLNPVDPIDDAISMKAHFMGGTGDVSVMIEINPKQL